MKFLWNRDMSLAPRDRPIVAWCRHDADPYHTSELGQYLTTYAAHAEVFGHADDGLQIVEWGGEYDDTEDGHIPAWWFVRGTDFEKPANPVAWVTLEEPL